MSSKQSLKILLADDHVLVREGLALLLKSLPSVELVGQVSNGAELIREARLLEPHIIITDLRMPVKTGVEALREINAWKKKIKCMVISMYEDEYSLVDALEAGAIGYINKNAEKEEFLDAVQSVYQGSPYYCKTTSVRMVRLLARSSFNPYLPVKTPDFSVRELKIIYFICRELSSKQIGEQLFMGKKNIDLYRAKILEKMNVKTTAGVAIYALKNNLFTIDELELPSYSLQ